MVAMQVVNVVIVLLVALGVLPVEDQAAVLTIVAALVKSAIELGFYIWSRTKVKAAYAK
jgi:hypothetical protein